MDTESRAAPEIIRGPPPFPLRLCVSAFFRIGGDAMSLTFRSVAALRLRVQRHFRELFPQRCFGFLLHRREARVVDDIARFRRFVAVFVQFAGDGVAGLPVAPFGVTRRRRCAR